MLAVTVDRGDRPDGGGSRRRATRRAPAPLRPFAVTLLVAGLLAALWFGYRAWAERHLTLVFAGGDTVPPLELTFYPDQLAFAAPSPPPPLGERRLDGASSLVVDGSLVPGHGLVRYRGDGIGTGFAFVELGGPAPTIALRPPQTLRGRVGEPIGFWFLGWRCAGYRPIADAEVVVMGGGEHGVDLATARTDADGRFVVSGFDGALDALGLRVRAKGYGIEHRRIEDLDQRAGDRALVALAPAPSRRGRLATPPGLDPTSLRVLARGLPGVEATPAADGAFTLECVPADVEARILLHGLPETFAMLPARTDKAGEVRVEVVPGAVVRGRVLDSANWRPVAGALVWCGDQEAARTGADGRYELVHLPPGDVDVEAQWRPAGGRRSDPLRRGHRQIVLEPGRVHEDVDISIDKEGR